MFRFIPTASTGVVQTFGKYTRNMAPGLRFYVPFIQKVTLVSNRLQKMDSTVSVKTQDNVFVKMSLSVQYEILPNNTHIALFSMQDPINQMIAYIDNVVRSRATSMKLDQLFESQDDISNAVNNELTGRMTKYGFTIVNTLIQHINPAAEVQEAMNKINASERLKHAAKNEADANYIKAVREAESERDRKRLQGEGLSLQRAAIIEGYRIGIQSMSNTFNMTPNDVSDLVLKAQYIDMLEHVGKSNNSKTLFLNPPQLTTDNLRNSILQSAE